MARVIASLLCASAICLLPLSAVADGDESPQRCVAKTAHVYGFHCWGSANFGAGFEVANFVGTVEGNGKGVFEGYGTVSSSAGSFATHFAGPATFGRHCSGRVQYTTNEILLPGGGVVPLGPAIVRFCDGRRWQRDSRRERRAFRRDGRPGATPDLPVGTSARLKRASGPLAGVVCPLRRTFRFRTY